MQTKTKTNPFRILAYSLFANHDWVSRSVGDDAVEVCLALGPMRRQMKIPSERFRSYLDWLQERGYIRDLEMGRGWAQFLVRQPTSWNWGDD